MSTIRIAVASTPLTATLDEAVPAARAAVEEAGRLGARIVCLPATGLPGHRDQARPVPDVPKDALDDALREIAAAARRVRGRDYRRRAPDTRGPRDARSVVLGEDGRARRADKDADRPERGAALHAGTGRRVFTAAGVPFGIAICHEAFRYPEVVRSLVLAGAQIVFTPHYVTTDDGSLPVRWCDASNPYNEKALLCRALENTVYVAASNVAGPDQGSATCIIAPNGTLVTSLDYGAVGVVAADIELDRADRLLALRWAPERNVQTVDRPVAAA